MVDRSLASLSRMPGSSAGRLVLSRVRLPAPGSSFLRPCAPRAVVCLNSSSELREVLLDLLMHGLLPLLEDHRQLSQELSLIVHLLAELFMLVCLHVYHFDFAISYS